MRGRFTLRHLGLVLALVVLASPSFAQTDPTSLFLRGWGVRAGVSTGPDQFVFGGHLDLAEVVSTLRLQPNVEVGLGDNFTVISFNGDALYMIPTGAPKVTPYAGGELSFIYTKVDTGDLEQIAGFEIDDTDTTIGLSAVGGVELALAGGKRVFGEVKVGLADAPDVKVIGGITF